MRIFQPCLENLIFHSLLYLSILESHVLDAEEIELRIIRNCPYEIYKPYERLSYIIQWDGEDPGSRGCSMAFRGDGMDYVVCVEATRFYIEGSGISVKFTSEYIATIQKSEVYEENESPTSKFCSEKDMYLGVSVVGSTAVDTSRSYFTLKVTAYPPNERNSGDTTDDVSLVLPVLVVLGIILMVFAVVGFAIYRSRSTKQQQDPTSLRTGGRFEQRVPLTPSFTSSRNNEQSHPAFSSDHRNIQTNDNSDSFIPLSSTYPTEVLDRNNTEEQTVQELSSQGRVQPSAPSVEKLHHSVPDVAPPSYSEVMNIR